MNWTLLDYVLFTLLLSGPLIALWYFLRSERKVFYRLGVLFAAVGVFLVLWVNGAVGILGEAGSHASMIYVVIPFIALAGAFKTRARTKGLTMTMLILVGAMALIPLFALVLGLITFEAVMIGETAFISVTLAIPFLVAAMLFRISDDVNSSRIIIIYGWNSGALTISAIRILSENGIGLRQAKEGIEAVLKGQSFRVEISSKQMSTDTIIQKLASNGFLAKVEVIYGDFGDE